MSTRTLSTNTAGATHGKKKEEAQKNSSSTGEAVQELVGQRRESLILERQAEVERVLDSHDDLVREAFHMEKFVSMLTYDPPVAKADSSPVFQQFKAKYDLVDQSASAGPSRTTRRAHNARMDSLKASSTSLSSTSRPAKKHKSDESEVQDGAVWSILSEVKSRGKGKAKADLEDDSNPPLSTSKKGKQKSRETRASGASKNNGIEDRFSPKAFHRKRPPDATSGHGLPSSKKRKLGPSPLPSISATLPKRSLRNSRSLVGPEPADASSDPASSPSKTPIRRVKLIVRRPEPVYSHYKQRPPPPKYESSVSAYLSSYTSVEDQDATSSELDTMVEAATAFWDKVGKLRREDRLLFFPFLECIDPSTGRYIGGTPTERKRVPDVWDVIIAEVEKSRNRLVNGAYIAGQVATRMKNHWTAKALGKVPERKLVKGKSKDTEKERVKKLAKFTAGLVMDEWKRAVLHIREEERQRRKDEEERRGREHLDAILNQSGRILEAQQADLARDPTASVSRSSRSSSVHSVTSQDEGEEEIGDSDDETNVDSDEDVDTGLLLGDTSALELRRSRSEDSMTMDQEELSGDLDEAGDTPDRPVVPDDDDGFDVPIGGVPVVDLTSSPGGLDQAPDYSSPMAVDQASNASHPQSSVTPVTHVSDLPAVPEKAAPPVVGVNGHATEVTPNALRQSIETEGQPVRSVPSTLKFPVNEQPPPQGPILPQDQGLIGDNDHAAANHELDALMALGIQTLGNEAEPIDQDMQGEDDVEVDASIPVYLRPYAVAPVEWDPQSKVRSPQLLRGTLRPYQQAGLEWLANIHASNLNGILADEMGLGKTIQTISLLAHLACDRGIWGPHLIIVPTSVLLNWEMEFKKFLPGFKILSYHGNSKQRKELRQGWYNKYHFNVCVTSYTLASRDAHVFKRKPWYYMILDEAHMIKNFKSQRWNILLMFRSFRRLLLTGTPLQNNLTELWALLQFLMSGTHFANLKEFGEWFSNPLEKAIEMGAALDDENQQRVAKLHTVLRPYLLRRLKRDVEKELPSKFEHLIMCPLSKRQRFLYDEFMARAETRHDLQSGVYQKIANILMQLRKVVNHPDLFEVRPIKTSFAMQRSAIADFEIKELLVRRQLLKSANEEPLNLGILGYQFVELEPSSLIVASETRRLNATTLLPYYGEHPDVAPPRDTRTIAGHRKYKAWQQREAAISRWAHISYLNYIRCVREPVLSSERVAAAKRFASPLTPLSALDTRSDYLSRVDKAYAAIKSYSTRAAEMADIVDKFAFVTPTVVARDLPGITFSGNQEPLMQRAYDPDFDAPLHRSSVKLQIAFPDPSLLQYDCGKLQQLANLLRERKAGGHRVLIFTQMTRILDILETFLNIHGYLYLRLDGATKIEDRQYITERFNSDARVFCFISSSRSGGVGINLTGADTVIFYDSDFNPQMDRQCEDRAHRIGQIRDVHIYRFVSEHTVEEALLRKANQKRSLDNIVIQQGEFDWQMLFKNERTEGALTRALGEFEDVEDARAAMEAAREEFALVGAENEEFGTESSGAAVATGNSNSMPGVRGVDGSVDGEEGDEEAVEDEDDGRNADDGEGATTVEYMLMFIRYDAEYFSTWSI